MSHPCDDSHPTPLTRFSDLSGTDPLEVNLPWAGLKRMFVNMAPKYVAKDAMPLMSGGKFGTIVTPKGSFRHDGNVQSIRVLVVDVDDWPFTLDEAMERLRLAGVAAILFTTPGHMVAKGAHPACARFRLLLPLSVPTDHAGMTVAMNRVNELLEGHVAPESWRPAQSYYCGRLLHGPWMTDSCEGQFIDLAVHVRERASSQPIPVRAFVNQAVNAPAPAPAAAAAGPGAFSFPSAPMAQPAGRGRPSKAASFMIGRLRFKGLFIGLQASGEVWMKCPFGHLHSTKDTPGDCIWMPPHTMGYSRGHFKCQHTSHQGRTLTDQDFLDALGIPPATPANQGGKKIHDFMAVRPTGKFLHLPTMLEWSRAEVDAHVPRTEWPIGGDGNQVPPSHWLATTEGQPAITQYAWLPGEATPIIYDSITREGKLIPYQDSNILNLWRPIELPPLRGGIFDAEPWLDHLKRLYPEEWLHIVRVLAFVIQHPGIKVCHGIFLCGGSGIGKDTIFKPLVLLLQSSGNWKETTPRGIMGDFNEYAMTIVLRLNEIEANMDTRGRSSYLMLYDNLKIFLTAPPETLPINRKGLAVMHAPNACFLIATSNGYEFVLNLVGDDRRAYVAHSEVTREELGPDYHAKLHAWLDAGGSEGVMHYLMNLDVSDFDPKAPPPMTAAKATVIASAADPMADTMDDLLDAMERPIAVSMDDLEHAANRKAISFGGQALSIYPRQRRIAWLRACGYTAFLEPNNSYRGNFRLNGRRFKFYARNDARGEALDYITAYIAANTK
jgi:hypothetical protein